jgi:hypothetical protein
MPKKKTELKFGVERIDIRIGGSVKGYLWATKSGIWWQPASAKHPIKQSWQQFDEWMRSHK